MKYVYSCTYALAALLVAGICLQSCTKKNNLTPPIPTVKNTSTPSKVNYADTLRGTKWSSVADTIEFYGKDSFATTDINVLFPTFPPDCPCCLPCCYPLNRNKAKGLYVITNDSLLAVNVHCVCPNCPPCCPPDDICDFRRAIFQIVSLDSERLLISRKNVDIIPPRPPYSASQTGSNLYIYRRIR